VGEEVTWNEASMQHAEFGVYCQPVWHYPGYATCLLVAPCTEWICTTLYGSQQKEL